MPSSELELNTRILCAGSDFSSFAGLAAQKAADGLANAALPQGIFGEFSAAEGFHRAVGQALGAHVDRLQGHHARLTNIARKGNVSAQAFSDSDADAAQALDSAGDRFGQSDS